MMVFDRVKESWPKYDIEHEDVCETCAYRYPDGTLWGPGKPLRAGTGTVERTCSHCAGTGQGLKLYPGKFFDPPGQ